MASEIEGLIDMLGCGDTKPLPRDIWYTEVFDGEGRSHVILINRPWPRGTDNGKQG